MNGAIKFATVPWTKIAEALYITLNVPRVWVYG
jgi:hypothetical protein